ncbi:MAG: ABC transporter substrate-binding protein [Clostridia bacterium]|nr:ABC transporter substrate-binding protein [Clostridia bacterium]
MKRFNQHKSMLCVLLLLMTVFVSACSNGGGADAVKGPEQQAETDASRFLVAIEDEPDTVDFQCTTFYYTIATNVFNRLVEMEKDGDGNVVVTPSLAKSWEISDDGLTYTFHLRENVRFSNGSPLTASDVLYTFTRLLTYPNSCNQDICDDVLGADRLMRGETDRLEGFQTLSDLDFSITLEKPFAAFLACLSMPGASILDEETTRDAGDRFGLDPACTVGTGSFILSKWEPGESMLLTANRNCWEGPPLCDGMELRFMTEPEDIRVMFQNGELDVLDLDDLGNLAEFFYHGDIYQDRLYQVRRIATAYIALNASVEPLNDVRVRKALQLSLNRALLLDAVYSGRGSLENGIFPQGLFGYNPDLPAIPYDPEAARELLAQAGYPDGFELTVSVKSSSTQAEMTLMRLTASMWEKIGVQVQIRVMGESEFMRLRKRGELACYTAAWTADFNDPDNFIYTFFGTRENTVFRSLCYPREDIMERVSAARTITDPEARVAEYNELERIIVQEDAAWIPLFSRLRFYVTSERVAGIRSSWNGSVKNEYRYLYIKDAQ